MLKLILWGRIIEIKTLKRGWQDAINYCRNLKLGGYSDWRLVSVKALFTIVDYNTYDLVISLVFKNVASRCYWSFTTYEKDSSNAWFFKFSHYSNDNSNKKAYDWNVRCIRDY